jgi:4-hydroxy-tetrahydrodipicolinate synthase
MNLVNRDGLYGVIVPILTPLNGDETVDTGSLRRLVNYMIEGGVHGIWAAGTTGEFAALDDEQKLLAIETVVDEVAGRVPVIGNISAPSTNLTVRLARAVQEWGLAGIAATPPYYYPCEQDEVIAHFRYIKEQSGVPLWVYNIPVTVKTVVEPQTMAALAGEGTVVGVKDSSGAGEAFAQLRALCDQGGIEMYRFLGSVFRVTTASAVGAHGVIPGIANLAPGVVAKAWEAGETGDAETARAYQAKVMAATKVMHLAKGGCANAASFSGMKSALRQMGVIDSDRVTRPLRPLTEDEKKGIPAILREVGI